MRVLVITENDRRLADIQTMLSEETLVCEAVHPAQDYQEIDKRGDYDVIILDLMGPGEEGNKDKVLERLRGGKPRTPILILSSDRELGGRLEALGFSAVQFVNEPFDRHELVASLCAIVRRTQRRSAPLIRAGELVVDPEARVVAIDDRAVPLTRKEYSILELLALRQGTAVTKEMFLKHLYGESREPEMKIIDVFICKLRKKLSQATGGKRYIETVWGRGYALRDPQSVPAAKAAKPAASPYDTKQSARSAAA
ncbi:MAG: response regulator transcription factor [Alphaproteobacteria bacterium]|nr:response regulator transcription factor [Alphaproteobacteria bacterium]